MRKLISERICDKGDKGRKDADEWENWWVKEFVIKVVLKCRKDADEWKKLISERICDKGDKGRKDADKWENW